MNKKIAAPGQLLVVWSTISEFCSIKDWHPAIADCKESKEGNDTFRVLTLKDNGGTIKEKLTAPTTPATATRSSKALCR